jgi:hypothetical protein
MMRIPSDAKIIRDNRITLIRVISTLYDRLVNGDDGLKTRVKQTMQDKGASFAESDLVVAALRAGAAKTSIDPRRLWSLVEAGQLQLSHFLDCISVVKTPLAKYLSGQTIDQITSKPSTEPEPMLFTEFKPGVELDVEQLSTALAGAIAQAVPITAA